MAKSFTLIEFLIVILILAILVVLGLPLSLNFYQDKQLEAASQEILQTLRRAQLKAMSIENDSSYGVYLTNDNYTLFKGSSFGSRDGEFDEVFDLPEIIRVSGIQQIVFSKFEGLPSIFGNIILRNNSSQRIININKIGRVNLQ